MVAKRPRAGLSREQGRREGGAGGAKYLGPGLVWGARNFDKTSGHCATVKMVGGPVMRNHLFVLGSDHGSRRPWQGGMEKQRQLSPPLERKFNQ